MSRRSKSRRTARLSCYPVPVADREQFIKDNAVALVHEKEATIRRLRKRLGQLERVIANLKREVASRPLPAER